MVEIAQHRRGRTPDATPVPVDLPVMTGLPAEIGAHPSVVGRIEQEGKRHLESLGYLEGIKREFERRGHQRDHRGHPEPGAGSVFREIAENLDLLPR